MLKFGPLPPVEQRAQTLAVPTLRPSSTLVPVDSVASAAQLNRIHRLPPSAAMSDALGMMHALRKDFPGKEG